MTNPERFREAVIFFNAGHYFEAHEAWEDVWRSTGEGPLKRFLQGLIQAAVGLHHLHRRNAVGARSQLAKSIRNLSENPSSGVPIDAENLIAQLERVRNEMNADNVQIRTTNLW
jgi:predicted metal-dependent hydrolase